MDFRQNPLHLGRAEDRSGWTGPICARTASCAPASWAEAFAAIAAKVKAAKPERIGALAGQLAGVEEMFALKSLMAALGSGNIDARYPGSPLHPKNGRASYLFNSTIAGH